MSPDARVRYGTGAAKGEGRGAGLPHCFPQRLNLNLGCAWGCGVGIGVGARTLCNRGGSLLDPVAPGMDPVSFPTASVSPSLYSKNGDLQRSAGQAGSFSGLQMGYAVLLLCICRRVRDAHVRSVGSEGLRRVVTTGTEAWVEKVGLEGDGRQFRCEGLRGEGGEGPVEEVERKVFFFVSHRPALSSLVRWRKDSGLKQARSCVQYGH